MRRSWLALMAIVGAAALAGCGLGVALPASTRGAAGTTAGATAKATATATATASTARATAPPRPTGDEIPTPRGPDEHAPAASSAQLALRRFASAYINWDAADVKTHLAQLATASVGQARAAMELEAAQTGADPELRQAGISNHGRVEGVTRLAGSDRRYVVITLETTSASNSAAYQGLAPAWHLTVATVAGRGGGWVISGWQPES